LELLNVLIIPDKFKGTLSAAAAAAAIACGWRRARPTDRIDVLPMTDGGDGFGETFGKLLGARPRPISTADAAHRPCRGRWWLAPDGRTAVVESANVIGLAMLPPGRFHPFELDTFGLGRVILAAAEAGARRCLVGLGGSATNDGGFGLARALGWQFLDERGAPISRWIDLTNLACVVRPKRRRWFKQLQVAVDVSNPLLGARGASRIYGPQKGLRPEDFRPAERALGRLAVVVERELGAEFATIPGAGAAGGLGFGFAAFLGARIVPGFELFARQTQLQRRLCEADLVITGEGALDRSTLMGKGVGEIGRRSNRQGIPCLALGGRVSSQRRLRSLFAEIHALDELTDLADAKARAAFWLERLAAQLSRRWRHADFS